MEQNPNEETVDVNASPQQPEAKDTLETTDDMDSQASVKMEGSTEADTSASQEKEAVPVETALETEPAQDTEKPQLTLIRKLKRRKMILMKKKRQPQQKYPIQQLQRQKLVQKECRLISTPQRMLLQIQPFLRRLSLQKTLQKQA